MLYKFIYTAYHHLIHFSPSLFLSPHTYDIINGSLCYYLFLLEYKLHENREFIWCVAGTQKCFCLTVENSLVVLELPHDPAVLHRDERAEELKVGAQILDS
jgi:hypothetical protein